MNFKLSLHKEYMHFENIILKKRGAFVYLICQQKLSLYAAKHLFAPKVLLDYLRPTGFFF